jgi:hypothetical protein
MMNVINQDQVLAFGTTLGQWELVTWVVPANGLEPYIPDF